MAAALVMVAAAIGWGLRMMWQRHKESSDRA
jgi:hypothetical protein